MADLRIVDAPEIPTENITGEEKLPTGGSGNYSISLDSLADYTKTKKDLADNTSVDGKVNGVRQELDAHIEDLLNPHQVTKGQIGLGNVDNTADADKPVSNSTQAAIISAVAPKADKTYVDNQLTLKANKTDVYTKQESSDLVNNSISTALTPVNASLDLAKRGIANRYDSSLTYNSGERVVLINGDIVKSTIDGNTNDPNVDMAGWSIKYQPPSIFQESDIDTSAIKNNSPSLQRYFRAVDDNRKGSIFIPMQDENYLLDEAVVLQEPTMIYGDKGATYNRGDGKNGNIVIGTASHAFDLGNYRVRGVSPPFVYNPDTKETKNPADQWTIKNLAFVQKDGEVARSKTALLHTSRTNGPDRGIVLREVSASGLKHLFRCINSDLETQIATFYADGVCASNNQLPFKFDGAANGGVIIGSQIEQNYEGAFHGYMNGAWFFIGNMMEGQPNAINVEVPPTTGNRTSLVAKGNYFELNSGDYVAKYRSSASNGFIDFAYNWTQTINSKDYILVDSSAPVTIFNKDAKPVTFSKRSLACYGSDFLSYNNIKHYIQRDFDAFGSGAIVAVEKFLNLQNPNSVFVKNTALTSAAVIDTPVGKIRAAQGTTFVNVPLSVAANDVVQINMLVYLDTVDLSVVTQLQVYDTAQTTSLALSDLTVNSINKRWALLTCTVKVSASSSSLRLRLFSSNAANIRILAGASAKVLSARVDGGYDVYPELPLLNIENVSLNYTAEFSINIPELAAGAEQGFLVTDANILTDDHLLASVNGTNTGYYVNAWATSAGNIAIRVFAISAVTARTANVKIKAVRG